MNGIFRYMPKRMNGNLVVDGSPHPSSFLTSGDSASIPTSDGISISNTAKRRNQSCDYGYVLEMHDLRRDAESGVRCFSRQSWNAESVGERCGTSDEIAEASAFLLGEHAGFITGTDLLIDGGVIASIRTGNYELQVR